MFAFLGLVLVPYLLAVIRFSIAFNAKNRTCVHLKTVLILSVRQYSICRILTCGQLQCLDTKMGRPSFEIKLVKPKLPTPQFMVSLSE